MLKTVLTMMLGCGLWALSTAASAERINDRGFLMENNYSTTDITVRGRCNESDYEDICKLMANYYARRFERDMIIHSTSYTNDGSRPEPPAPGKQRPIQKIVMELEEMPEAAIASIYTTFTQLIPGMSPRSFVEMVNLTSEKQVVSFAQLFDNSEFAAMICSRAVERAFQEENCERLPLVVAAIETDPRNFRIVREGLRFYFAPGTVSNDLSRVKSLTVTIPELFDAGPSRAIWGSEVQAEERKREVALSPDKEIIEDVEDNSQMTIKERRKRISDSITAAFGSGNSGQSRGHAGGFAE